MDLDNRIDFALNDVEKTVLELIEPTETVELLQSLVRIDTVNPPGNVELL